MQVAQAFVSGSLGQAIYREDGDFRIIDDAKAESRDASPNEIQWFTHTAREVVPAHPEGLPISIDIVRARLDEEIRFFNGLDGLLVGMDRDFSEATRRRAISRAENILATDEAVARRIRHRFLIPANAQEWDPVGGLALALRNAAKIAIDCYRLLAEGIIDRLSDDINAIVLEKLGGGIDAARAREAILRSGILAELALVEGSADRRAFSAFLFRRGEFPKLQAIDPSGQILAAIIQRMGKRASAFEVPSVRDAVTDVAPEGEMFDQIDPIAAAVERAIANLESNRRSEGSSADLPGIQRQIAWIGERLNFGETARAEHALVELINRQGRRSRAEDLVKTLTAVADLSRGAKLFDWSLRMLASIDLIGPDSAAGCVRAETLRALGRPEEALAAFEDTMQRFPQDEVAPNGRAETLRALGRREEALAAFEATMRRFPRNEVTPNGRAETLRALGRHEEALAAFEDTMRRFPRNEVAPNGRAETLRALGRPEEALAAFEDTMRRFPQDEVAPNGRAETLRALGRHEEALAAFEDTMRRFPQNEVARNGRAETLRALGRHEEALAAFEDTMRRFPQDEVARTARAETLRALGRPEEALAAFEDTMRRFPQDEVVPTARAETLRALGRPEEALAAFEDTMRRFPRNEVARNGRAETLRDLGRHEEALAAFEDTMRRFPQDEVAPTARAETLRDLGRPEEALAAFEDAMRRFPQDEVAPTARAETLRDLGRPEEALAAFEDAMRRFPQNEVAPTARAETLRDLGRPEEALAAFEDAMRRFPQNEVAQNARAETLRDLGRPEEALAAFEDAMRRFPQNEVAPNARAETLRDLGRPEEALAAFEGTMRRFPHNEVARNAYAHLLSDCGRMIEAEVLLAPAAKGLRTRGDWIAMHILATMRWRAGRVDEALAAFERGLRSCPFRDERRYFATAMPLALLSKKRAMEAAQQWEILAQNPTLPREERTNILLFQAHALAESGEPRRAQTLVESAQIVDLAAARQRRLAVAITERYGLVSGVPASAARAEELSGDISTLEFELVRPRLWNFRAQIGRAA